MVEAAAVDVEVAVAESKEDIEEGEGAVAMGGGSELLGSSTEQVTAEVEAMVEEEEDVLLPDEEDESPITGDISIALPVVLKKKITPATAAAGTTITTAAAEGKSDTEAEGEAESSGKYGELSAAELLKAKNELKKRMKAKEQESIETYKKVVKDEIMLHENHYKGD